MSLEGVFPSSEAMAVLQAHGYSLVSSTGPMLATKLGEPTIVWDEALARIEAEQAEAPKGRR